MEPSAQARAGRPLEARQVRPWRAGHAAAACLLAGVLAASFLGRTPLGRIDPQEDHPERSICILRRLTGLPCPTCGMTRSFSAIARGDLWPAVAAHPLGPLTFAASLLLLVRSAGIALTGRRWMDRVARVMVWSLPFVAAALLALWVWRLAGMFSDGSAAVAWHGSVMGRLL